MEDRWSGSGETGAEFRQPGHLYCDDLNILGDGSLFQLLCVARSRMGQECLADWLLRQSVLPTVAERQAAVAELASKLDFRESLATAGEEDRIAADHRKLKSWAQAGLILIIVAGGLLAALLGLLAIVSFIYAIVTFFIRGSAFWSPFVLILVLNGFLMLRLRHGLEAIFHGLDSACHNLEAIADLVRLSRSKSFNHLCSSSCKADFRTPMSSHLKALRDSALYASWRIRAITSSCVRLTCRCFTPFRWVLLCNAGATNTPATLSSWTDALGQIEALFSLATFSYEHPEDSFPEFNTPGVPLSLEAESHWPPVDSPALFACAMMYGLVTINRS